MPEQVPVPVSTVRPNLHSRQLPPYRGILAVDAKDFTGYPAVQHGEVSRIIPQLLHASFSRAELPEVWEDRRFPDSTGDGYVFGFDPASMPYVIHPWLNTLQEVLTEFNLDSMGTVRIRLRVSLHIGPLPDSGEEFDGNGTPRNDTHRLLDSVPVKAVLASHSENITHVAAILSERCFQDAVASGYTGRDLDYFIEVPATVPDKRFQQRAWLYVPHPSGNLYVPQAPEEADERDATHAEDSGSAAREASADPRHGTVHHVRAERSAVNSGPVEGGQHVTNVDSGGRYDGRHVGGDYVAGDHVGGGKAGTVHGNQGDTVHGDKHTGTGRTGGDHR